MGSNSMRTGILITLAALGASVVITAQERPLRVVATVDYEKYAGTWYEIARLPNRFQDQCTGDVARALDRNSTRLNSSHRT